MRILKIEPERKPERADIPDTLEAMQKVADGKATKIIIPSELQGFAGLASGIAETVKATK